SLLTSLIIPYIKMKSKGKAAGQIDYVKVQKNAKLLLCALVTVVTKSYDTSYLLSLYQKLSV
ncbi:MAG: hypothetical protein ACJ70Z_00720, partial [Nitrososphaera sp.]